MVVSSTRATGTGFAMIITLNMEPILLVALFTGFLAALAFILLLSLAHSPAQFACEPMQTHLVPYRRRSFLFSAAERSFYNTLRGLVPDHMIFVKVRLGDLVDVSSLEQSFWRHFNPIQRKLVDFVVCDPTLSPVVAIELDHSKLRHDQPSSRDQLVNSVLANVALPVVRIPERRRYIAGELRRLLSPYLRAPAPVI